MCRDQPFRGHRHPGSFTLVRLNVLAARVGHDPARIAGHSTRRGFITSAARAQVLERDIMRHSRHSSVAIMQSYIEDADVWTDNAAVAVGCDGRRAVATDNAGVSRAGRHVSATM